MLVFCIIASFIVAKLEINIEGKDGWAKNLPTWRIKNRYTKLLLGESPLTGYHLWLFITIITLLQFAFFIGLKWSISLELQIVALFFLAIVLEDFFWFVFNPYYGIKKFNKINAHWHIHWVGILPMLYLKYFVLIVTCLLISFII